MFCDGQFRQQQKYVDDVRNNTNILVSFFIPACGASLW